MEASTVVATDSTSSITSASSTSKPDFKHLFKEMEKVFSRFFQVLFAVITFALAAMNTSKQVSLLIRSSVFVVVLFYLANILATMLQFHVKNLLLPLIIMLMLPLGGAVSVLALMVISPTNAWIVLALWLFIFALLGYYYHQELYQIIPEKIKNWIERRGRVSTHNSVVLPGTATGPDIADDQQLPPF